MSIVQIDPSASKTLVSNYSQVSGDVQEAVSALSPLLTEAFALLEQPGQNPVYGPMPALIDVSNELASDGRDLDWRVDWMVSTDAIPMGMTGKLQFNATGTPVDADVSLVEALKATGLTNEQVMEAKEAIIAGGDFTDTVDAIKQKEWGANVAGFRRMEAESWTVVERSPFDEAQFSLDQIRDVLDTARQDKDEGKGIGYGGEIDNVWSTNDLKAIIDNRHGYYTDEQVAHAETVLRMAESSSDAQAALGITQSGGGWSWSAVGHITLDVFGMVPVVGNVADGINAAWYAAEGEWLDAALSSVALIPGAGQAVTLAKPAIKAAASGIVFKSLDDALQWAKRWLENAGILRRGSDGNPEFLYRGDNAPFSSAGNAPNSIKSHIDPDTGDLLPANPDGTSQIHHHVRGGEPVKSDSPFTSMTSDGAIADGFGDHVVRVNRTKLEADIAAGRVEGVEVLSPRQVQEALQTRIDQAQRRFDAHPTGRNADRLAAANQDLAHATRDSEYLLRGVVPAEYVEVIT